MVKAGARTGSASDRPTLLMVGSGDPMDAALKVALDRRGLFVEAVTLDGLAAAVHVTAPDVVLLVGDAAADGGAAALSVLSADASAAVPVVLLARDERLESRMHAFRHGAMAVVPRSASADAVARRIVQLERDLSEHFEEKTGEIGEATFDELVELVKNELRSGILSVHAPGSPGKTTRVVLGAGRPVAEAVSEFVQRLRPHVQAASEETMYYQFHTSAGGPVGMLELGSTKSTELVRLPSLRALVIDDDPTRADTLAQELRQRGALVFVTDTKGSGLQRAIGLDPQVAIIDSEGLQGVGFDVIRRIRKDMRLRWASMLVADWSELWPQEQSTPDMHRLSGRIEVLLAHERDLAERAAEGEPFDVRLESMGPARMLRVLVESGSTLHLSIRNPKARIELDLAEGLIVGAISHLEDGTELTGTRALASLLALGSGRVHIEHRANPAVANVMTPVDEALSAATAERDALREYGSFAEDEPASDAHTAVKNLEKMAKAQEKVLRKVRWSEPGMPSVPKPSDPPPRGRTPRGSTPRVPRPDASRSVTPKAGKAFVPKPGGPLPPLRTPRNSPSGEQALDPPAPEPVLGGPVAAGERSLSKRKPRRKKTLVMGAAVVPPPDPAAPDPSAATERPAPRRAASKAGIPGAQAPSAPEPPSAASQEATAELSARARPARQGSRSEEETVRTLAEEAEEKGAEPVAGPRDEATSSDEATAIMSYDDPALDGLRESSASGPATRPQRVSDVPTVVPPSSEEAIALSQSVEDDTLAIPRAPQPPSESGEGLDSADLESLTLSTLDAASPADEGSPPIEIGSLPLPSEGASPAPEPDPPPPQAAPPVAAPAPEPVRSHTLSTTDAPVRRKSGVARTLAKLLIVMSAMVLLLVVALIGYRYSGLRQPQVDQLLTLLGAPPPDTLAVAPTPTPPPVEPPPVEPPPVEPPPVEPPPVEPNDQDTPPVEPPPVEPPPEVEPPPVEPPPEVAPEPEEPGRVDLADPQDVLRMARDAGDSPEAERLYRRVLELDPREHHAMVGLARLMMDNDRNAEAVPLLEGAIARRPRRVAYLVWLGDAMAASGDAAGAQRHWQRAHELDPDNRQVRRRLGL